MSMPLHGLCCLRHRREDFGNPTIILGNMRIGAIIGNVSFLFMPVSGIYGSCQYRECFCFTVEVHATVGLCFRHYQCD